MSFKEFIKTMMPWPILWIVAFPFGCGIGWLITPSIRFSLTTAVNQTNVVETDASQFGAGVTSVVLTNIYAETTISNTNTIFNIPENSEPWLRVEGPTSGFNEWPRWYPTNTTVFSANEPIISRETNGWYRITFKP